MSVDMLTKFRETTALMDPTRPLKTQQEQELYVEPPHTFGQFVARALQLEPTGSMLLVGSIGCGKSTELLAAGRRLLRTPGVFARYVDVSVIQDLTKADYRAVLAAIGHELAEALATDGSEDASAFAGIARQFDQFANGFIREYSDEYEQEDQWVQGVVTRPKPAILEGADEALGLMKTLGWLIRNRRNSTLIWLLDGLDKLPDGPDFDSIVEPVVNVLKEAGIGVAVVAPRKAISGVDQLGAPSVFDEKYQLTPWDPETDVARDFLVSMLDARDRYGLFSAAMRQRIVDLSGGVPRMLVQLARLAIREAFIRNALAVEEPHVDAASRRLGQSLLMGLSDGDVSLLDALRRTGAFVARSESDWAQVAANRVLERVDAEGRSRFRLHPALEPYFAALASGKVADQGAAEAK